jgi:hypothetical protein
MISLMLRTILSNLGVSFLLQLLAVILTLFNLGVRFYVSLEVFLDVLESSDFVRLGPWLDVFEADKEVCPFVDVDGGYIRGREDLLDVGLWDTELGGYILDCEESSGGCGGKSPEDDVCNKHIDNCA